MADGEAPEDADDWYRWGRLMLYGEMVLATLITGFSLYMAFQGSTGFLG